MVHLKRGCYLHTCIKTKMTIRVHFREELMKCVTAGSQIFATVRGRRNCETGRLRIFFES